MLLFGNIACQTMKDQFHLLIAGLIAGAAAWGLWFTLGSDALSTFLIFALMSVCAENHRLRKQIKNEKAGDGSPTDL